jgi:hypothetical protein
MVVYFDVNIITIRIFDVNFAEIRKIYGGYWLSAQKCK